MWKFLELMVVTVIKQESYGQVCSVLLWGNVDSDDTALTEAA